MYDKPLIWKQFRADGTESSHDLFPLKHAVLINVVIHGADSLGIKIRIHFYSHLLTNVTDVTLKLRSPDLHHAHRVKNTEESE